MNFFSFLKYPIVRHFLAGGAIVALLYFFSIAPLQEQNKELRKDLKDISVKQGELIAKMANKDTYKVENHVNGAKIKKGGEIKLTPDTDLKVSNVAVQVKQDSVGKEKERTWVGRQLHKIGNLFRKNDKE